MSQLGFQLQVRDLSPTEYFVKRLTEHRRAPAEGDASTLKERIRQAILTGLDCTIIGKNAAGKPETYAQSFQRFYGEPLVPTTRKGK
jgi:hypothetical protein